MRLLKSQFFQIDGTFLSRPTGDFGGPVLLGIEVFQPYQMRIDDIPKECIDSRLEGLGALGSQAEREAAASLINY